MGKVVRRNRNYEKTEKAIINSLIVLGEKKSTINDITVKELCELADISRSTFYLHYSDIQSIFDHVSDQFLKTFEIIITDLIKKEVTDFSSYIKDVFKFINKSDKLIKIGLKLGTPINRYVNEIKQKLEDLVTTAPMIVNSLIKLDPILIEIKIVSSGIIDLFVDILKSNKKIDEVIYTKSINDFLTKWVNSFIR